MTAAHHQRALEECWLPLIAGIMTEALPAEDAQNLKLFPTFSCGTLNSTPLFQFNRTDDKFNNSDVPKVQNVN